jgi:hypothetical protein
MSADIDTGYDNLLHQASLTSTEYLIQAIRNIDGEFGAGYAKRNPDLVAAFIRSSSNDFNMSMLKLAAQDIRNGLVRIGEALEGRQ